MKNTINTIKKRQNYLKEKVFVYNPKDDAYDFSDEGEVVMSVSVKDIKELDEDDWELMEDKVDDISQS